MLRYLVLPVALAVAISVTSAAYAPPAPLAPPNGLPPGSHRPGQPIPKPLQPQPPIVNPIAPGQPQVVTPTPLQPQLPQLPQLPQFPQLPPGEVQPNEINGQDLEYVDYQDQDNGDGAGFVVQSGIEGYVVPENLFETTKVQPGFSFLQRLGLLFGLTKLPKFGIALFPTFAFLFKHFGFLLLIGGALTTAVCAFTPFCGIALGVRSENDVFSLKDKAWDAASFVINSIDKYRELARQAAAQKKNDKKRKR